VTTSAKSRIFYGWVIVLVSFLTLVLVMGVRFTFGVFYISILAETGWSRAATAGIFSVSMIVYAIASLGVGAAFDRLGPRRMFPFAALLLGGGLVLCSTITSLWQFYLYYGVVVGIGFTALGFVPHVSLISRWFVRQRGLANSLALSGQGVGAILLAPLSEYLIASYGWRSSYMFYGLLIPIFLIPLIVVWHRDSPQSLGLRPDGDNAPERIGKAACMPDSGEVGSNYLAVIKTGTFWALFFIVFSLAFNHMTLVVHQNQYLVDSGFKPEFAAWMLGLSGILRSGGAIIWGSVSDRARRETSFSICSFLGFMALPCLILAQVSGASWQVVVFVILMGLGYGGVSVVYAASAADLFHGPDFGKILGLLDIGFGLGAAIGSYLAGWLFDRFQSYHLTFYVVMGLMLISITCIWTAAPRRARISAVTHNNH
jgi:MFS family permease